MDDEKIVQHDDGSGPLPLPVPTTAAVAVDSSSAMSAVATYVGSTKNRPTTFQTNDHYSESKRTEQEARARVSNETTTTVSFPSTGSILSINDSLSALLLAQQGVGYGRTTVQGQGQGDVAVAAIDVVRPPLSPDSYVSSTCSGDMESPTTSGSEPLRIGGSGASSPTSSATSSGMSIGPEYAQNYPQPSVRPKDHRNATWPDGLTSSSVGAGVSSRQRPRSSGSVGSLPLDGKVTRDGEMVSYVADDLLEKIRRSASPRIKGASSPSTISQSSSRSSFACSAIPAIDPTALADLEKHSKRVADSLDLMLGHLTSTLHNMSAISVGHIQTYRDAVDKAGLTVDQSVKAMYALIAKCEELSRTMMPVEDLAKQIKAIKKQLDEFEAVCK